MIGGLNLGGGLEAMMTLEGGTDGDAFVAFLEHVLGPTLLRGDLVVMDNAGAHGDGRVPEVLAKFGAKPVFQPPYSPDLNRIELAWAHLKDFLRSAKTRTVDALNDHIAWGMEYVRSLYQLPSPPLTIAMQGGSSQSNPAISTSTPHSLTAFRTNSLNASGPCPGRTSSGHVGARP